MKGSRVAIFSVVPSPYQRDLFQALAKRPELELSVFYQERQPDDSPWPEEKLESYERVLPGFYWRLGRIRSHWNWGLPRAEAFDLWVVNASLTSVTAQWLMRGALRKKPWLFWGERLRPQTGKFRTAAQDWLSAPLGSASGIVGIGTLARSDYAKRFPGMKTFVVPYCCRLDAFSAEPRLQAPGAREDVTFLFCGQMIERKGVDLLLEAFGRLVSEHYPVRLMLVGREAELPGLLERLPEPARQRVRYEGFQAPANLPRYFAQADAFILPSRYDGWGVVVNQAMGAGLPVLTSDAVGAARDWVTDGVNGRVFVAGDGQALYEAMKSAADNRERLKEWGASSSERAAGLSPEAGAEAWVKIVAAVFGEN
jgi:glycosyltransferase involved in cell wall biosynthesis